MSGWQVGEEARFNADERKWTQMNANGPELNAMSKRIIGCAFAVANTLGSGFLEKVYENALAHELRKTGLVTEQQRAITVFYDGTAVGEYFVDLLVENAILLELKTVRALDSAHRAQCLNYLRATGLHLCLLMNFGAPRQEFRRIVQDL
jgi:GxxExxY protein